MTARTARLSALLGIAILAGACAAGQNAPSIAVRTPEELLAALPAILLILTAAWLLIGGSQWLLTRLAEAEYTPRRLRVPLLVLAPTIRLVVIVVAVLVVMSLALRLDTDEQRTALVIGVGAAAAFGLKDYFVGVVAGIVALIEGTYRQNDWVEMGGCYGQVQRVGVWAIQIRTPDDSLVTIPHAVILDSRASNANNGQPTLLCVVNLYAHPDHDAAAARGKLLEVCATSPYIRLDLPYTVLVSELPGATRYQMKAYPFDSRDQFQFASDLTVQGKAALSALGISPASLLSGVPDLGVG